MEFLGKLGVGILLVFSSLWSSTLELLHLSQPVATSTPIQVERVEIGQPKSTVNPGLIYSKDNIHVYFGDKIVEMADPHTFVFVADAGADIILRSHFAKDKNGVYDTYFGTILKGADPSSFVVLNYAYSKDKSHIYTLAPGVVNDPSTVVLDGADPTSFEAFYPARSCGKNCSYDAQDKNHKYLDGRIVGEDVQSNEKKPVLNESGEQNGWYSKDEDYIYFGPSGRVVEGADLNTFVAIGGYIFARDKNHLYDRGLPHSGGIIKDTETFSHIGGAFYKDSKSIYLFSVDGGWIISEADRNTFEVLSEYYAKDSTHVFFSIDIVEKADPATFIAWERYGKDVSHVYLMSEIISSADPVTFITSPTNVWAGKDKNHEYFNGQIVQ